MVGLSATSLDHFSSIFEPALLAELKMSSQYIQVKENETMLNLGQTIRAVPLVLSGIIKVSRINDEGQELFLYYVNKGESCAMTFTCCMMQHESVIKAVAEEDGELLAVPVRLMDEWMIKYPDWKKFVMTTVLNRFNELLKVIDSIAFNKMDERLVSYLKRKSKVTGSSIINSTHQQIADELATNRVVVSRLLKKLEDEKKLLLYRHQIKLLREL
jgi:CRP/FNR family transcriptional regulator